MQIKRAGDLFPKFIQDELLRLARLDRDWVDIQVDGEVTAGGLHRFRVASKYPTWVKKAWVSGADAVGMWGASRWLLDGPKFFYPTPDQCAALEQVEVGLTLDDYAQPYPALCVVFPDNAYLPFQCCLCHLPERRRTDDYHAGFSLLNVPSHREDITTTVTNGNHSMEASLQRYDADCAEYTKVAGRALRAALNCCLALVNFGHQRALLFPREAESDARLAREPGERGQRARDRVASQPSVLTFAQEVALHATEHRSRLNSEPTGREVETHWRRGHWRMQACGVGRAERRRTFIKPVLVRADRFAGDASATSAAYRR